MGGRNDEDRDVSDSFKILVVEDDDAIRTLILATLPEAWHALEAADGLEAIALAQREHPDVIILDFHLPLVTGEEVCGTIRREAWSQQCRIVGLTASSDPDVRRSMSEAGIDAFLNKPFSPVQLLDLIDSWENTVA